MARPLLDVFSEIFMKDDLERAMLAVRAALQLVADEPHHSAEVEAELAQISTALNGAARVLAGARRRFDQLSPGAKVAMRSINMRLRRILVDMALTLDGKS